MHKAKYEILPDDGTFYGEIPGFDGVYANSETLESCRDELEEVLEEWILFRVSKNLSLPIARKDLIGHLKKLGFKGPYSGRTLVPNLSGRMPYGRVKEQ